MGERRMESILFLIVVLLILYAVIYFAVKGAIDNSEVGQIIIKKFGDKKQKQILTISDEEIEKALEDDEKRLNS